MERQTLKEKRLRAFVLDRKTGRPLPGVPIQATAVMKSDQEIPLAVLASDHAGFVSFDLEPLSVAAQEIDHISIYQLGDETSRVDVRPLDQLISVSSVIPILIDPSQIDLRLPRPQLPSIQGFDRDKCFVSPNSFFTNPSARLGEGGCEILLPSNSATHEFRFRQVVRTIGEHLTIGDTGETPSGGTRDEFATPMRLARGYVLEYQVTWYPLGHSLGRLLYSLPLAPCESVNLAVIDWSRRDEAMRREDTTFTEELTHTQRRDRMIEETVKASLEEWQGGGSFMAGHAGAGSFDLGGILSLGAADAMGASYSSTGGERDLASTNIQKLSDNIVQKSSAIRNLRSTVIAQVSQQEHEVIETRTVTNHNHCHAMTILYYEVLRHYRVVTECVSKQRVLFIDHLVGTKFDEENALCQRLILERVLLDPRLLPCFDALVKKRCYDAGMIFGKIPSQSNDLYLERLSVVITGESHDPLYLKVEKKSGGTVDLLGSRSQDDSSRFYIDDPSEPILQSAQPKFAVRLSDIAKIIIESTKTRHLAHFFAATSQGGQTWILYDGEVNANLIEDEPYPLDVVAVPSAKSEFALTAEELCCAKTLLSHLNCHKPYYWNAIWLLEDPNERVYRFRNQSPYKEVPLLTYIENHPVGSFGDDIAFPELGSKPEPVTDDEGNPIEPVVNCVALPVHGVFAEAQLGRCNACEERDITRFWDWSESPCPERAPEIAPITAESRAQQPELQPTAMPNPIVNIVNPPAAPDPTGLVAALNLLATPNIFRDMSGLQEVSDLLQKLSEGAISLAQARQKAKAIQERQQSGGVGGGGGGSPTPQEQLDQWKVYEAAANQGVITYDDYGQLTQQLFQNAQYRPGQDVPELQTLSERLGFDGESLAAAAAEITSEQVLATIASESQEFGIPEGGWRAEIHRRDGSIRVRWIDFWRRPVVQEEPEVYTLIQHLQSPQNANLIVQQLSNLLCQEKELDAALTIVTGFRESGTRIFSNQEFDTLDLGGLDVFGEEVRQLMADGYLRRDFEYRSLSPFPHPEGEGNAHPAMVRGTLIVEATGSTLNRRRDRFLEVAREFRLADDPQFRFSVDGLEQRSRRIWNVAYFGVQGGALDALRRMAELRLTDLNQVVANHDIQQFHVIMRGHIGAAEAKILELLVIGRAMELFESSWFLPPLDGYAET